MYDVRCKFRQSIIVRLFCSDDVVVNFHQVKDIITGLRSNDQYAINCKFFIIVVSSHGIAGGNSGAFVTHDSQFVDFNSVVHQLSDQHCVPLAGKPKIFKNKYIQ